MSQDRLESMSRELGVGDACKQLLAIGLPREDLVATLERIGLERDRGFRRRWNFYRELVNTIRGESAFLKSFLSVDIERRREALKCLRLLYMLEDVNYRDRLILLTKFILAQINPLGNAKMRQAACDMVQEFILHPDREVRNATFRGITFEVARLRLKGGHWYVEPLIDLLVSTLKEDKESREYLRRESMEVYYTQEQRDVVDDILVAVNLSKPSEQDEEI
ncbi:MAG: hypothetical protein R3231_11415 [bacterium]|nr:hypothetical protein [bacterium]